MPQPSSQGSFIPQDVRSARLGHMGGLNDLFTLSGIFLLVASAALGAGVFLYEQYLQAESTSKVQQLKRAKEAFEPALIEQFTRLDDRMHAAGTILDAHIGPSTFFHTLEQATLQTVSFRNLMFNVADPTNITGAMDGVARSVNSVALQADLFSKSGVFTNPIFSGINRQVDGVNFRVTMGVDPRAINYAVRGNATAQTSPALPVTSTASTTPPSIFESQGASGGGGTSQ